MLAGELTFGQPMTHTIPSDGLYARTLHLAKTAPRHVKQRNMAEACGLKESWISSFINEHRKNPNVHDLQRLHDYLVSVNAQ
jgi:transcriptional regulator with XRE-family HTH domain